jgi:hypothetical protein
MNMNDETAPIRSHQISINQGRIAKNGNIRFVILHETGSEAICHLFGRQGRFIEEKKLRELPEGTLIEMVGCYWDNHNAAKSLLHQQLHYIARLKARTHLYNAWLECSKFYRSMTVVLHENKRSKLSPLDEPFNADVIEFSNDATP